MRAVVLALLLGWGALAAAASLQLSYQPATEPALQRIAERVQHEQWLERYQPSVADLRLPQPLWLVFAQCDEANAYYSRDEQRAQITLCYEDVQDSEARYAQWLAEGDVEAAEIPALIQQWFDYSYLHELGHALIDLLELPALGREEDVADQLAAYFMFADEDGELALQSVLDGYSEEDELSDEALADPHALNAQRAFNMLCWAYGADAERYAWAGEELPEARREGCADEYAILADSFEQLLAPYWSETAP